MTRSSFNKMVGWLLLVGTVGIASCQAFFAERPEPVDYSPGRQIEQRK
jgi:hypothetical protein